MAVTEISFFYLYGKSITMGTILKCFGILVCFLCFFGCGQKSPEIFFLALEEGKPLYELKGKFNPNFLSYQDSMGNTAMHLASKKNNIPAVLWLLSMNSSPFINNNADETAYNLAVSNGYEEIEGIMEQQYLERWRNLHDKFDEDHLIFAIENDLEVVVAEFLKNGTDPNQLISSTGVPLLIVSIFSESDRVAQLLLDNQADPNIQFDTRPALHIATMFGQYQNCALLLGSGADPNAIDGTGTTALMIAMEENYQEITALLLKAGADEEARDFNGFTAAQRKEKR